MLKVLEYQLSILQSLKKLSNCYRSEIVKNIQNRKRLNLKTSETDIVGNGNTSNEGSFRIFERKILIFQNEMAKLRTTMN